MVPYLNAYSLLDQHKYRYLQEILAIHYKGKQKIQKLGSRNNFRQDHKNFELLGKTGNEIEEKANFKLTFKKFT